MGTTGYAKDMLKETLEADVAIVETVAHTKSALHYYQDVDVIVDVGGQDIKVIILKNGKVKDFKLNTQYSAGNGYFLQGTAAKFGYSVAEFADAAFEADRLPVFGYGCAVFMETDIVNFQQLGWEKKEIMAGLAKVLPKNIWLYVVAEPNLSKFGTNFVLQGGTQHNLAAVKSQYDFIKSKVPNVNIRVHEFTGESGAIGAALEAIRLAAERDSTFIGLGAAENLEFTATREESTRCSFCKNKCLRTFIDTKTPEGKDNRFIIATCEKGTVEKLEDMKVIKGRLEEIKKANPNFVEKASVEAFRSFSPPLISSMQKKEKEAPIQRKGLLSLFHKEKPEVVTQVSAETKKLRDTVKIAMPRVLNMYTLSPFFAAYFEALGINFQRIIYSDYTDPMMWYKGSRRGSIDQCFPSKVAIAHIHNLIFDKKHKPDIIFFPIIQKLMTELGRPYHNDPGLNHEIMAEIQKKGYPIFSVDSLPQDEDILKRLFGEEVTAGVIADPMDITDVWKNCYSENSSKKVWGAKYVARHPNLVAIDLSSFKCGHDAPIYNTVENIIEVSNTPYFTFHDIDENKPSGSIKIRVETIDYFLAALPGTPQAPAELGRQATAAGGGLQGPPEAGQRQGR